MIIRHSTEEDIKTIMEIYAHARLFMEQHDNPNQWGPTNWPPERLIRNDIDAGKSYVCVNDSNRIVGTFFYDYGNAVEETYNRIEEGSWLDESDYGVVHRIASDGTEKGIGSFCINWAYEKSGKHLRIDTHSDNYIMQRLLKKLGFEMRGIIHVVEDNYPRYAYEKINY